MGYTEGQKECIETFGVPMAVAAGAGTGKTFTITRRIANAFATGQVTDIDQVLTITFTNKAASELKDRIKGVLRANGLVEQALKVDGAWISTIHGMCSRILKEHALELGIDPCATMPSEEVADDLLDQSLEAVMREGIEGVDPADLTALFRCYGTRTAYEMVRELVGLMRTSPLGPGFLVSPRQEGLVERELVSQALSCFDGLVAAVQTVKQGAKRDEWLGRAQVAEESLQAVLEKEGWSGKSAAELMSWLPEPSKGFGSKEYKELAEQAKDKLLSLELKARLAASGRYLETLIALASQVYARYQRLMSINGYLTADDLITLTAKALKNPEIAACYRDRFRLVMVDEFQDTDQLQVDIVSRLAGEGGSRLCVVGDYKQSIYRFRGADVSVYLRHVEEVKRQNGKVISLSDNFRSHGDVLKFVDAVCGQEQGIGSRYVPLRAANEELARQVFPDGLPRIQVLEVMGGRRQGAAAADVRREQALGIATRFDRLREAGWRAGDMVVLLAAMSSAQVYADALQEVGLPVVIAGGSVFSEMPEPGLVTALASCLAQPYDGMPLLQVLGSPLFCLQDSDLVLLSQGKDGRSRALSQGVRAAAAGEVDGLSNQCLRAAAVLVRAWHLAGTEPLTRVMSWMLSESGYLTRQEQAGPAGQASVANIYKALRIAQDLEQTEALGPRALASRLGVRIEATREAPGALSTAQSDFVRIMTIHASKGLEFPIVAVGELSSSQRGSNLTTAHLDGHAYVSLDLPATAPFPVPQGGAKLYADAGSYADPDLLDLDEEELVRLVKEGDAACARQAMRQLESLAEADEKVRLLYVALTRARESLVVSIKGSVSKSHPEGTADKLNGLVVSALAGSEGVFDPGVTSYGYGGSGDALVERIDLPKQPAADEDADEAEETEETDQQASPTLPELFVPTGELSLEPRSGLCQLKADALFSYSSLVEAGVGQSDALLARLGVSQSALAAEAEEAAGAEAAERPAAVADDRATDFGSAFHLAAQRAVRAWRPGRPLEKPSLIALSGITSGLSLSEPGQKRLDAALGRWLGSSLARRVAGGRALYDEVPFTLDLAAADGARDAHLCLEGDLDLLMEGQPGQPVLVVDYKTGGSPAEGPWHLRAKHGMQAVCYGLAVLKGGADEVELEFVRVEQADPANPAEPQQVGYHFSSSDVPWMEELVGNACKQAQLAQAGVEARPMTDDEQGVGVFA